MKLSLRAKILLTIISLTLLSLGVFSYLTFSSYKKDKLAFVYDHLASETQSNAILIKSTLESYDFFLGSIIPGINVETKSLPVMTSKFLESRPLIQGLYYHVPSHPEFSRLTLHQRQNLIGSIADWDSFERLPEGLSLVDGNEGVFAIKKSLSVEKSYTIVIFKNPELAETIRSTDGRFNFVLRDKDIISKDKLELGNNEIDSIKKSLQAMKAPLGLFEVKVLNENHIASYTRLPAEKLVLVNLIRESKVLLIQKVFLKQVIIFLTLMGSIALLIGTLSARWLTIHLDDLTSAAHELEKENFDHLVNVDSHDEMGTLGKAFNSMSGKIRLLLEELRKYNAELEQKVEERTRELRHLSNIQDAMLNSLGQGFVMVDSDHNILPVYSRAAVEMFETIPDQVSPAKILGVRDEEGGVYKEFFDLVFQGTLDFEDMAKMNPDMRSNHKQQKIQLNYAAIRDIETNLLKYVMVIGTDKTLEIENMEKFKKEWNFSQMMMKISSNRQSLNKLLIESLNMLDESQGLLEGGGPFLIEDVQRQIHTIRGNFSYFNILEITQISYEFEEFLGCHLTHEISGPLRTEIYRRISEIKVAIECYIDKYDNVIMFKNSHKTRQIPVTVLNRFMQFLSARDPKLVAVFEEQFFSCEIGPYFQMYSSLVKDLAVKLNKKILFSIEGGEQTLPEGPWEKLFSHFVHFVRNSADHGIEPEAERVRRGKRPEGEIKFSFKVEGEHLEIRLRDDGRGVDWNKIALKDPTVNSEEEAIQRILSGGVSSRDEANDISGRGVGVSALANAVLDWGGRLNVLNQPGESFTIMIRVPIKSVKLLKSAA